MSSLKQSVIDFLAEKPDDISAEEIIDFIYVQKKISTAEKAIQEGKTYTLEDAKKLLEQWRE